MTGTGTDVAVARYNIDGSLDTTFGTGGKILTPVGAGTSTDVAYNVIVQRDGRIIVAGFGTGNGTGNDFALVRYNTDGSLDTTCGPDGTGKILTPVGTGTSSDSAPASNCKRTVRSSSPATARAATAKTSR